jgi:nickel/cobalt exporter
MRVILVAFAVFMAVGPAFAQSGGWWTDIGRQLARWQMQMNASLSQSVLGVAKSGSLTALGALCAVGFLYGVFHAAGPGHGKGVVLGYFLDSRRRWIEGVWAGTWIAITHTISAAVIVAALVVAIDVVPAEVSRSIRPVEIVSYSLVTAIGLWRLYAGVAGRGHDHCGDHGHNHPHGHSHTEEHDHGGHRHGHPATRWSRFKRSLGGSYGLGLFSAAGVAPCSGAMILMLVSAAHGILWAGLLATLAVAAGMALTLTGIGFASMLLRRVVGGGTEGGGIGARVFTIIAASIVTLAGGLMLLGTLSRTL